MAIITYELDSTHTGIRKRLERKNVKWDLANCLADIREIHFNEALSDAEKLKQINLKILNRL